MRRPLLHNPRADPGTSTVTVENTRRFTVAFAVLLAVIVLPLCALAQSNESARSSMVSIELAFGIDTEAEAGAANEMAACRRESRWRDLAAAASNAVQRWPKEQYFEQWVSALSSMNDVAALPGALLQYIQRCPHQRPSLYQRWAHAMRQAKRTDDSMAQLRKWIDETPRDSGLWNALAEELVTDKRYDEALRTLKDSLEYATDHGGRRSTSARIISVLEAKNDLPAAIDAADQALSETAGRNESDYELTSSTRTLVRLLRKAGRLDAYIEALEKRLAEKTDDRRALRILAEIATAAGDNARTVKYRSRLAEGARNFPNLTRLREALERTGATNEEVAVLEKILASDEARYGIQPLVERLALLYASTGATAAAWALLDGTLADQPTPDAYSRASAIALRAGDRDRANLWINAALTDKTASHSMYAVAMQLMALGRHADAVDFAFPADGRLAGGHDYHRTQVIQGLVKDGKSDLVRQRLSTMADAQSTNAAVWRQLASFHQDARDFTNAAACWKKVVELAPNSIADYQYWINAVDRTDDLKGRVLARQAYLKAHPRVAAGMNYMLLDLARDLEKSGRTNDLEAVSDILLEDTSIDVANENIARICARMGMVDRAARHLQNGVDSFERKGLIPQGQFMRNQLIDLYLKNGRGDDVLKCLEAMARHAGAATASPPTLKRCTDAVGPERWKAIVEAGEAPYATLTQQVMAAFMLTGSNEHVRARAVLERAYVASPGKGTFDMLKTCLSSQRDMNAVLALHTNHLALVPSAGKDGEFVQTLLSAYAQVDPAAGVDYARTVYANFQSDSSTAMAAARLLQRAGLHGEVVTVYTNLISRGGNDYLYTALSEALDTAGSPAKGVIVALHGRTTLNLRPYALPEYNRLIDRLAARPGVLPSVVAMAESAQQGGQVDCPYADKVDWPAVLAWAAERTGDYTRALTYYRKTYEKMPTPENARALASVLFKAGSPDEAIAIQTRVLQDASLQDRHSARMELIRMLVADLRFAQAGAMVEEAMAAESRPAVKKELEDLRAEIEGGARQQEFVKKAVEKADANQSDEPAQRAAAQALRLTGRYPKAAEYYRRALALDDLPATRWDIAHVLTASRKHKEAIAEYRALLERNLTPQEHDSAIKAIAEAYDSLADTSMVLEFLTSRIEEIRSPNVKNWATARIRALREQPPPGKP